MERFPLEIYQDICEILEVESIGKLRLVSKYSCEVATPFLLSEIHLIFKKSSFDDLIAVSKHPTISPKVTSIYYEPDILDTKDRFEWESSILDPGYLDSIPVLWWPNPTDEDRRAHAKKVEEHEKRPRHTYTNQQLDVAWIKYQQYLRDQQDHCRQRYGIKELQEAMRGLPKVTSFYMSMANNLFVRSDYLKQAFSAGLSGACGDDSSTRASGVPQLRSCLLSMRDAGTKLQKFKCGDVSWKLFRCSKSDLKAFAATLSKVRNFRLQMSTGMDASGHRIGVELPECRRFLRNGRVRDLISGADDLEKLDIGLNWWEPTFGLELVNVVGDCIWSRLSKVTLTTIETTEEHLMHFLERHKATLQRVHLDTMLLKMGEWPSLVPRMRSSLHLASLLLEGRLFSDVPRRDFDLGMVKWDDARLPEDVPKIEKRKAIEVWFREGGDCPFTEEWSRE